MAFPAALLYSGSRLNFNPDLDFIFISQKGLSGFWGLPVTVNVAGSLFLRSLVKACRVRHEYVALPSSGLAALI